ncbi:hypothetical protein [Flavobacterium sp. K5-23]|uniref:hypothetical protein n=1 Tax=Flavobacterium sp. K5-23 TaxID=2746225 RepID=UPI00200C417F|nr:hypothetical protein [Flavobacterium sp. K5-23]UQD54989.1 hypothetical protein FLAK523_00730 [Flavobacterium sp. K5-23]
MKKIYSLLLISLSVLYSCSDGVDNNLKLLKKVVEVSDNGSSETTLYTYDDNNIVSIDGVHKKIEFTYTFDLITKIVTLNKVNQEKGTVEYSYREGRLVKADFINKYVMNYLYNTDGTISYEKLVKNPENLFVREYHGVLFFDNKNFTKDERILDNIGVGVIAKYSIGFDYDDKKSPMLNVIGFNKLYDLKDAVSINNSLISTEINSVEQNDQVITAAKYYKSTYKYDAEGYPIEKISETGNLNNTTPVYIKSQFFY